MKNTPIILLMVVATSAIFPQRTLAQNVKINERVGVVNSCGDYPDRSTQRDYLKYGAIKSRQLGFEGIEVIMIPRSLCSSTTTNPKGCYSQSDQYCADGKLNVSDIKGMVALPQFKEIISMPFKKIVLYIETVKDTSIQQASVHADENPYSQTEIDSTYNEVKEATKYLLNEYRDSGKTFYIAPINELDNRLVQSSGCLGHLTACDDVEVPAAAINKSIVFINTYAKAIQDAKAETTPVGVKIYLMCEINRVISRSMRNKTSAANDVIPYSQCDIVGYSAYETYRQADTAAQSARNMIDALNYIASKTRDHPDFGNKNVMIGEIGFPEISNIGKTIEMATAAIKAAMNWGVPQLNLWTLFDQGCDRFNPGNADCAGFWMIKPDGTKGKIYNYILSNYSVTSPIPGDLIDDQDEPEDQVNIHDYNQLVTDFGKTGSPGWIPADINDDGKVDIFDYNILVGNFGK